MRASREKAAYGADIFRQEAAGCGSSLPRKHTSALAGTSVVFYTLSSLAFGVVSRAMLLPHRCGQHMLTR